MTIVPNDRPEEWFRFAGVLPDSNDFGFVTPVFCEPTSNLDRPNVLYVQDTGRSGAVARMLEYSGIAPVRLRRIFTELSLLKGSDAFVGGETVFAFQWNSQLFVGSRRSLSLNLKSFLPELESRGLHFTYFELARFLSSEDEIVKGFFATSRTLSRFSPEVSEAWRKALVADQARDILSRRMLSAGVSKNDIEALVDLDAEVFEGSMKLVLPTGTLSRESLDEISRSVGSLRRDVFLRALGVSNVDVALPGLSSSQRSTEIPSVVVVCRQKLLLDVVNDLGSLPLPVKGVTFSENALPERIQYISSIKEKYVFYLCDRVRELEALAHAHFASREMREADPDSVFFLLLRDFQDQEVAARVSSFVSGLAKEGKNCKVALIVGQNLTGTSPYRLSRLGRSRRFIRRTIEALVVTLEARRLSVSASSTSQSSEGTEISANLKRGDIFLVGYSVLRQNDSSKDIAATLRRSALNYDIPLKHCHSLDVVYAGRTPDPSRLSELASRASWNDRAFARGSRPQRVTLRASLISEGWVGKSCAYVIGVGTPSRSISDLEKSYVEFVGEVLLANDWMVSYRDSSEPEIRKEIGFLNLPQIWDRFFGGTGGLWIASEHKRIGKVGPIYFVPVFSDDGDRHIVERAFSLVNRMSAQRGRRFGGVIRFVVSSMGARGQVLFESKVGKLSDQFGLLHYSQVGLLDVDLR